MTTPSSHTELLRAGRFGALLHPILLAAVLAYFVLVGGTSVAEVSMQVRAINAAIGGAFIAWYALRLSARADQIDRIALGGLLLFIGACVFSAYPRQSLDAAVSAVAFAAAYSFARRALESPRARRLFAWTLIFLSISVTTLMAIFWFVPIWIWWTSVDFRTSPPLGLELSGYFWGHRHDAALLVLMLYPGWWLGSPSAPRRVIAIAFGVVAALLVLVDASRTLWIGVVVATAVVLIPRLGPSWEKYRSAGRITRLAIAGLAIAGVLVAIGVAFIVAERAMNLESLGWRGQLWRALVEAWGHRPFTGIGPGSFPWILQQTSYFDTNSWAPRHPDNAIIHMLAEGGILGLAAMCAICVVGALAIKRASSAAARWVLVIFAVASLGGNPSDFAFAVVLLLAWGAYALPARDAPRVEAGRTATRYAMAACLAALAVAQVSFAVAHASYETARHAAERNDVTGALTSLETAVSLDPAMTLYGRERGTARYLLGDLTNAETDLAAAAAANPSDDVAWRSLALVRRANGDIAGSKSAVQSAVNAQRSDPTNLLLRSALAPDDAAVSSLTEVVQAWPQVVFAGEWTGLIPPDSSADAIASQALRRYSDDEPMPELAGGQEIWLDAFVDVEVRAADLHADPLAVAVRAAIRCELSADDVVTLPTSARRSPMFWLLRYRTSSPEFRTDSRDLMLYSFLAGVQLTEASTSANPVNENEHLSADAWGYRRATIHWPSAPVELPSIHAALARWVTDPQGSADSSGLSALDDACSTD